MAGKLLKIGTPEEFQAWCQERAHQIIGKARSYCDCPIANWLTELNGRVVVVGTFVVHGDTEEIKHPRWVREFIARVDMSAVIKNDNDDREPRPPITGKDALGYLAATMEYLR